MDKRPHCEIVLSADAETAIPEASSRTGGRREATLADLENPIVRAEDNIRQWPK